MPKPEIEPIAKPTCASCKFWNGNQAGGPKAGNAYDCNNPVCASGLPTGMFIAHVGKHTKPMTSAGFGCIHHRPLEAVLKEIKT